MKIFKWLVILIIIEVVTVFAFAGIYTAIDTVEVSDYLDGLYLSVQLQTAIGVSGNINSKTLRSWLTVQSIISDILNLFLIAFIGIYIGKTFVEEIIEAERMVGKK
jgi:hypothetical protein